MKPRALTVAVVATGAFLGSAGASSAYWTATASGAGTLAAGGQPLTAAPVAVSGLYPGAVVIAPVALTNHGDQPLLVQSLTPTTATSDGAGCPASAVAALLSGPGAPVLPVVPAATTVTLELPVAVGIGAPDACQGATFTLSFVVAAIPVAAV